MSSPYYRFDGIQGTVVKVGNVSSDITIYSLVVKFYLPESVTTSSSPVSLVGTDNYRGLMLGDIGGGLTNEIISFGYTSHYSYWSDASGVIAAGQHEISLVWDGSKYQIYLDGVAKTTSRVGSLSLVEPTDLARVIPELGTEEALSVTKKFNSPPPPLFFFA